MPTFIISMSDDRAKPLVSGLKMAKFVNVEVIPGILGQNVFKNVEIFDHKAFEFLNGRSPLAGEVGCAYTHYSIYERIIKQGHEWSLILEDDSRIAKQGLFKLETLIRSLYLDKRLSTEPCVIHLKLENRPLIAKKFAIPDDIKAYECLTVLREANAYLININAARMAVSEGLPLRDVADWPHWISRVLFLAVSEDIFSVDRNLESEIGTRLDMYKQKNLSGVNLALYKILVALRIFTGYEYYLYTKNTRLNDYYYWNIRYRLLKATSRILGRRDPQNSNVYLIPWLSPTSRVL